MGAKERGAVSQRWSGRDSEEVMETQRVSHVAIGGGGWVGEYYRQKKWQVQSSGGRRMLGTFEDQQAGQWLKHREGEGERLGTGERETLGGLWAVLSEKWEAPGEIPAEDC